MRGISPFTLWLALLLVVIGMAAAVSLVSKLAPSGPVAPEPVRPVTEMKPLAMTPENTTLSVNGQSVPVPEPKTAGDLWFTDPLSPEVVFRVPAKGRDLEILHIPRVPWRVCHGERCLPLHEVAAQITRKGVPQ